jgi:TetR/AcrR family transcriptional regulator, tetracycline repressor protein
MTGPVRSTLSRVAIVDAALDLMSSSTASSLTMRRLGEVLGVDATAVYRHFRDKAELMRAVGDRLIGEVTLDVDRDEHWRTVVITVCMRLREAMLRQPQLAATLRDAPALEAGEFAITEMLLQQFLRAGLSATAAATAYHSVIELTVGSATIDAALDALADVDRERRYDGWRQTYAMLPPDQYPASRLVAGELYRGTAGERFALALGHLLDGIVPTQ